MQAPNDTPAWLDLGQTTCFVRIRATPGAKVSHVVGEHGRQLKISVAAPPVDGKANEALLGWLANVLMVRRRDVRLLSGQGSRDKRVSVTGVAPSDVVKRLIGS